MLSLFLSVLQNTEEQILDPVACAVWEVFIDVIFLIELLAASALAGFGGVWGERTGFCPVFALVWVGGVADFDRFCRLHGCFLPKESLLKYD